MTSYISDRLAFIDTETLGSDKDTTKIIEIAVIITDFKLKIRQEKSWIFPLATEGLLLSELDPVVVEMHAKNGLWRNLLEAKHNLTTYDQLDNTITEWIGHQTGWNIKRLLVAGSGFDHFDRPIVARLLPKLANRLTYFSLDIGSAERILQILGGVEPSRYDTDHRALTCVRTQINRMRDYVGVAQRALGLPIADNVLFLHEQDKRRDR